MRKLRHRTAADRRDIWLALAVVSFLCLIIGISGCEVLTKPQGLDQRIAVAYSLHTGVQQAAATSVSTGTLSSEDGEQVLELADQSRTILDGARLALTAGDIETAEGRLMLATSILTQLQTYLHERAQR